MKNYLTKYCPDVEVVGMADSVPTGLEAVRSHKPDLVFLDVEMPYGNAFDLLEQVETIDFSIIFVTAYSHYAIQALNLSASYYLLKPIDIDELVSAVDKVKAERSDPDAMPQTRVLIENIQMLNKQMYKLVLPVIDGFEVVHVKDIIRCQANGNFTWFYLKDDERKLICRTLKYFDDVLSEFDFMRVHKSHLINMQYVKSYKRGRGGQVLMSDGSSVDVSVSKKQDFLNRF